MEKQQQTGIIYVRVSSEEQVSGTSLDRQERECRKYCEQRNIKIEKVFREEGVSAKSSQRREFIRAIEYCRTRKKRKVVDAFVVHKCDRFARNVEDHYMVRRKLMDYGTQLHSVTEPIDDSPQGKVFEAMLSAFAEFDNSIRRERCIAGMSARIESGIYPWKPPIGYICQQTRKKGIKKEKPDKSHPEIFPIIQRGLKKFANGGYTKKVELLRDLENWGFSELSGKQLYHQAIERILYNYLPFYAGILKNPFTNEEIQGKHKAMISLEEYHAIRYRLDKMRKQPTKKTIFRNDFPLRQLVCCASCGNGLTGSFSKGRGGKYPYYHCHSKGCPMKGKTIRKEKLETSFDHFLKDIVPDKKFWKVFKDSILNSWEDMKLAHEKEKNAYDRKIVEYGRQLKAIRQKCIEGVFTNEEYKEEKERIENLRSGVSISRNESNIEEVNMSLLLKTAHHYSQSMVYMWRDMLAPEKRKIFTKFIFDGTILYHRETDSWNHTTSEYFNVYKAILEKCDSKNQKSRNVHPTSLDWNKFIVILRLFESEGMVDQSP